MLRLKINNSYQTMPLNELRLKWGTPEMDSYKFSKSQLNRIKQALFDGDGTLSDENIDVYTDEDFEHPKQSDRMQILLDALVSVIDQSGSITG